MMFVYHCVIIPFHPQYLPRHAPQGGGIQRGGIWWPKTLKFTLLLMPTYALLADIKFLKVTPLVIVYSIVNLI